MARQPFNTRWAQGVESEDNLNTFKNPGDLRLSIGWEGGQDKDAPPAGHENFWHNRVDSALQGVERNGVMSWHPQALYGMGAPAYGADGNYYESTVIDNVGNNPVSTVGFWRYCGSSFFSGHSPGDLKIVAHNKAPTTGWLKCNGAILTRSSYQLLFEAIGTSHNIGGETVLQFRLPDYRAEFLRGFDDGRGVDQGRVFGSAQEDSVRLSIGFSQEPGDPFQAGINAGNGYLRAAGSNEIMKSGSETRGRNKTVNYWIRY